MKKEIIKKIIFTVVIITSIIVSINLTGCVGTEQSKFLGQWYEEPQFKEANMEISPLADVGGLYFNSDGTFLYGDDSGTWLLESGTYAKTFTIVSSKSGTISFSYSFSNNDKILTLTSPTVGMLTFSRTPPQVKEAGN